MRETNLELTLAIVIAMEMACRLSECCSGRKVLNGQKGIISDGPNKYPDFAQCEWLIEAGGENKFIHLEFKSMVTECSFDFLFVYDGNSYSSPLLASLSGDSHPDPIIAKSGYMLLYLFSDWNYMKDGFEAHYTVLDCPNNCTNNGKCINHSCHCVDYYGESCDKLRCPDNCSNHGNCTATVANGKTCVCDEGYVGPDCGLSTETDSGSHLWYKIATEDQVPPRTSHSGVFQPSTNCLWVFGGFDLNNVLDDLVKFCFHDNHWTTVDQSDPWPSARKGHAGVVVEDGFYIFGGSSLNDTLNGELWFYNTSSASWSLMAANSSVTPPPVTGHTLTLVDSDWLYLFGGKTMDVTSQDSLHRIRIPEAAQWEAVAVRGGNFPRKRLSGHSTVYHKESRSLVVFGGYSQASRLVSTRTNHLFMFNVDDRFWSEVHNRNLEEAGLPFPRAFHSAVILGNYMLIYGGNTHQHHKLEVCYSSELYLYHLGCHVWKNDTLGYLKPLKGRFGHIAATAKGDQMIIMGGYSGRVRSDLLVYKVSPAIASHHNMVQEDMDHCLLYFKKETCLDDPDCVYCSTGRQDSDQPGCVHRTRTDMCVEGDVQDLKSKRCPGICAALSSCSSCVSQGQGANLTASLPRRRVYNQQCSWCVKQAVCTPRNVGRGTCLAADNTPSGIQGWWDGLSSNLTTHHQCQLRDSPAGLHWIEYRYPMNKTYPDHVSIIRQTEHTLKFNYRFMREVENVFTYTGTMIGFIYPLNAPSGNKSLELHMKMRSGQTSLYLSRANVTAKPELVLNLSSQMIYNESKASRPDKSPIFPNVARGSRYYMEIVLKHQVKKEHAKSDNYPQSNVKLEWNGALTTQTQQALTAEFLQPYSGEGESCLPHYNCLACLTDVSCGWCEGTRACLPREDLTQAAHCSNHSSIQFLITTPSYCPTCDDYVDCQSCAGDNLCEWVSQDGHCTRRHRIQEAVIDPTKCRTPCERRETCSRCLQQDDECAWCENTHTCLPFTDYVPRYKYGQCTGWIDNIKGNQCHDCTKFHSCTDCRKEFGCGWCYNDFNPTVGLCVDGDFLGTSEGECSALITVTHNLTSLSLPPNSSWAYDTCPDVDECSLGLHDCHENATCENSVDSYHCECNQGFKGNGRSTCNKACMHQCIHGNCSGPPDHVCVCLLGWSGDDCSTDCGCNNHSTCDTGLGVCDMCQHGTTGQHCQLCKVGSYGNPLDPKGCSPCECNGHGDIRRGICNNETRECYCTDNTQGEFCHLCEDGFYGNPVDGQKCYLKCDDRKILTNITKGALGTHQGSGVRDRSHVYCLWLMTVYPDIPPSWSSPPDVPPPQIQLAVEGDMEVKCGRDLLYIYDGIPSFISGMNDSATLLGAFCSMKPGRDFVVVASSGVITVYLEADMYASSSRGFNASFQINECPDQCVGHHRECKDDQCVCRPGFGGVNCEIELCPRNCSYNHSLGECNLDYGMCECMEGFVGAACNIPVDLTLPRLELLIDPNRMKNREALPPPMMGHTLTTCGEEQLYLFGGVSPSTGLQADMWIYDMSTRKWERVEPGTEERPTGRYYHAAACVPMMKVIYIFGGFVASDNSYVPTNQLWKFNIESKIWTNITQPQWLPPLAGHTFTHTENTKIFVIGGFSPRGYYSNKVFVYDAGDGLFAWKEFEQYEFIGAFPIGLYGHTAVYDSKTSTIFTFGGYLYRFNSSLVSHVIYTFDVRMKEWNLITVKNGTEWKGRVFHASILYDNDTMVTIGGQTQDGSYAADILVYNIYCNTIVTIPLADLETVYGLTSVSGLQAVRGGGSNFIMGGFSGKAHGSLTKLILPNDICMFIKNMSMCRSLPLCSVCTTPEKVDFCFQTRKSPPPRCVASSERRSGSCREEEYVSSHCGRYPTCSQCLARYPSDPRFKAMCKWCQNCPVGRCIAEDEECSIKNPCRVTQNAIDQARKCPEYHCPASDCETCHNHAHCSWSRRSRLTAHGNWTCLLSSTKQPFSECPRKCHTYTNCSSCLGSHGGEGGSQKCIWSQTTQECMSPAYLPLHCSFGECGFVIQEKGADNCPRPCSEGRKCADCVTMPGCGWCAVDGQNGLGACLSGGLHRPTSGQCSVENITSLVGKPGIEANSVSWSFGQCPPENECINSHHTCDSETQDCRDTPTYFRCDCKKGYYTEKGKTCEPVCHQGCVQGECRRPDDCKCHFGWVGDNCSTECMCNKHSDCKSKEEARVCLSCQNNTQGNECQECRENFVGDPKDGGHCIPCLMFCYNHSSKCLTQEEYHNSQLNIDQLPKYTSYSKSLHMSIKPGPKEGNARCVDCKHNTTGEKCESCLEGYFRLQDRPRTEGCIKCQCNGHSDVCNAHTGENCKCHNNTESKCESKDDTIPCWKQQCSQCKEYFIGTPTDGHQCYRQMTIDREYCFDPETQKNCNLKYPQPLHEGRTVFFSVPPKYLNVDIRITIDVTIGGVDVYFSNHEKTFVTEVDGKTGVHHIYIDDKLDVDYRDAIHGYEELARHKRNTDLKPRRHKGVVRHRRYTDSTPQREGNDEKVTKLHQQEQQQENIKWMAKQQQQQKEDTNFRASLQQQQQKQEDINFMSRQQEEEATNWMSQQQQQQDGLSRDKRSPIISPSSGQLYLQEVKANDLNTFITIKKQTSILVVRDVRFRLVITLPRDIHELKTSHFFVVLRSKGDSQQNVTYGSLYFRQDQPHIDLFVFFSVFFSCFFLFLAMCVMLWKMKQAFDARRNRQLRAQEMVCMASRPFAKVLVLIKHDYSLPTPISFVLRKSRPLKLVPKNMHCPNPSPIHLPPINIKEPQLCTAPIAIEPTDDGIAAVGTILIQLPGDIHAPTKLCLGSALTMRLSPPVVAMKGNYRPRPSLTTC